MPKFAVNVGDYSEVEPEEGGQFDNYEGPVPPKGLYQTVLKLWRLKKNKNGDHMFMILFEIDEPKTSEKSKYNGYAIFHNQNLTQQGAPYLNGMLDALGFKRAAVWKGEAGGIVTDPDSSDPDQPDVTKIGGKKTTGLHVSVTTYLDKPYKGKRDLSISTFASGTGAVEDDVDAAPQDEFAEEIIDSLDGALDESTGDDSFAGEPAVGDTDFEF